MVETSLSQCATRHPQISLVAADDVDAVFSAAVRDLSAFGVRDAAIIALVCGLRQLQFGLKLLW